jgi:thiamine-monophosphate kinase
MSNVIQSIGEFDLIAQLTKGASVKADGLSQGVGDDCAIFAAPGGMDWLITTDALVENVHFKREWSDFRSLGRKAISANLSDIAAMGGAPRFYLVTLGMPKNYSPADASELYRGMGDAASGALLIGGDTVVNPDGILLSITVIGDVAAGRSIMRGGAEAGDVIFATGSFGGSALGLKCLGAGTPDDECGSFVKRHLNPTPLLSDGKILSDSRMVNAMIDVSDGLVADFGHIADMSGKGFEIFADTVPRYPGLDLYARGLGYDSTALALTGGEEYELLFTVGAECVDNFEREIAPKLSSKVTRIGKVLADSSVRRVIDGGGNDLAMDVVGFDHFS